MAHRHSLIAGGLAGIIAVMVALSARIDAQVPGDDVPLPSGVVTNIDGIFSAARIFEFDNTVARLDTTTGALHRFSGRLTGNNARGTWRLDARPLTTRTSGFLQIQQAGDGTFLVDAVTGEVWVLRRRNGTAAWIEVPVQGG